ncbi:TonB-dependent receptor [Chondrinema litorale]|uniref:TonB-dependent receptor n=1 Tax=Chondrinema litorale TaxID=2994555 RepID=UPI002543D2BC|nr:TonB-dependent receptor [Chondrinema litorale]UZR92810.1 TonB-dependent receptor [Chondrinema litorale]
MKKNLFWVFSIWLITGLPLCTFAQKPTDKIISLNHSEGKLKDILDEISSKTQLQFTYNLEVVNPQKNISLSTSTNTISGFLEEIFSDKDIELVYVKNKVIIKKKESQIKYTINGYVKDAETGEDLIGASLLVKNLKTGDFSGVVSNLYGFYAIQLPKGNYQLTYAYLGYQAQELQIDLAADVQNNIDLLLVDTQLSEVVIEGDEDPELNINEVALGTENLNIDVVKEVAALAGEVDIVKTLQLLPGIVNQGEGSTNFFVRGGGADQNMILLDEAPVYNASHLMGFFSVFNADAIKDIQFYRSGFPAEYGGRLSSLLDIRMKEGNNQKLGVSGGIGTLASRLTVEGPIKKDKSSFILSARRTYADMFLRLSADEYTRQTSIYFYDFNAKANFKINSKNRLYFSGYFGKDLNKVRALQYIIDWSNTTATLRWNHLFNERLFSNTTLLYSRYNYLIDLSKSDNPFNWQSTIRDYTVKSDFDFYANESNLVKFGFVSTLHRFEPGMSPSIPEKSVPPTNALEHAVYFSNEQKITNKLSLNYGLRLSAFQLMGATTLFAYNENNNVVAEEEIGKGEIYKTYFGFEPRITARYKINEQSSVKANYSRTYQYMQMLSSSTLAFNVFDVWLPTSKNIKPQYADMVSLGYFKNLSENAFEFSAEVYYKKMYNQLDYVDHAQLIMNRYLEASILKGEARAYGLELTLRKKKGNLSGWLSYTLSKAERKIKGINGGVFYPAAYDQPHSFSAVGTLRLNERWTISANWVYSTGRPVTLPTEIFQFEKYKVPVYNARFNSRLPDYHRLDLSATLHAKPKPNRKNNGSWVFSIYNAYARKNALTVFVGPEMVDLDAISNPDVTAFQKVFLYSFFPSVTYNFKF